MSFVIEFSFTYTELLIKSTVVQPIIATTYLKHTQKYAILSI